MALHSAQGPRLGLPQMISSRAQFGVIGAVVPLVLVVLMYLGFASTGTVLAGQAISRTMGLDSPNVGIVVFGILSAVVAIVGYRWIHAMGRVGTVVGMAVGMVVGIAVPGGLIPVLPDGGTAGTVPVPVAVVVVVVPARRYCTR